MFLDERGTALRVTWHPERDLVVLSVWQGDRCVGTFRMPVQDVPRLSGLLAAALGGWVDQADNAATSRPRAAVQGRRQTLGRGRRRAVRVGGRPPVAEGATSRCSSGCG